MVAEAPTSFNCPKNTTSIDKLLLTIQKIIDIIELEHLFAIVFVKGVCAVSEKEMKLIELLRENDNPEQALILAVKVFAAFLAMSQEPPERILAALLESA